MVAAFVPTRQRDRPAMGSRSPPPAAAADHAASLSFGAMQRSHYDVMMLSPAADGRLVVAVYRHLAKRYHPDLDPSPEAAARMAELNEAYAVLSDRGRRARYDESLGLRPRGAPEDGPASASPSAPPETVPADASPHGEAGPPPTNPAPLGSRLTFGRYRGWALNQVGRFDRDYLEWLSRTPLGRNYRAELEELLRRR
jgi:curved DNA-binding protein CbpA